MDPRYQKRNKALYFYLMSFGIFVSFQKKVESLCLSNFIHMFTYKCKYVLFQLNMLRLFQEINMFFFL